jgi:hypothetical protein
MNQIVRNGDVPDRRTSLRKAAGVGASLLMLISFCLLGCQGFSLTDLCWTIYGHDTTPVLMSIMRDSSTGSWTEPIVLPKPGDTHELRVFALTAESEAELACSGEHNPQHVGLVTASDGVQYASSDPATFTVVDSGLITAVGVGTATLTVTYGDLTRIIHTPL